VSAFLEVEDLAKDFGGIHAVDGLSLALAERELLCVIGPNGCGKTTLFNLITGEFPPSAGRLSFRGKELTGLRPFEISRLGIGRKFQVPAVYPALTVRENLAVPLFAETGRRGLRGLLARDDGRAGEASRVLDLVRLADQAEVPAGELSHGQKQWLEIGLLLASRPRLMLLDEPTAGMTLGETEATAELILRIHAETETAVVVIEHDMGFVRRLGCPVAVMLQGRILCRGSYEEVSADPRVREAYLGGQAPC
jgi:urea ABC transporter ATP-binding protein UrtD